MAMALVIAGLTGLVVLLNSRSGEVPVLLGYLLYCVTWPVQFICELLPIRRHHPDATSVIVSLSLMIPYCFLVGYSIAGLIRLLRGRRQPVPTEASAEELAKLVDDHRTRGG